MWSEPGDEAANERVGTKGLFLSRTANRIWIFLLIQIRISGEAGIQTKGAELCIPPSRLSSGYSRVSKWGPNGPD